MQRFEAEHHSVAERGKQRCGDHVLVRVDELYVIVAVSDGVGSRPCDWLASSTTCHELIEAFVQSDTPLPERLQSAVLMAHRIVQNQSDECSGMLATLVAAVWENGDDCARIVSVGDSRIYSASATAVTQVSSDDSSAEIYTRFDKPHIVAGAAVTFPVITRAIGQQQPLAVEVQEIPFARGESLILATDGMNHVSTFEERTLSAVRSLSLSDGISQLVRHAADNFADDATIAILRRNDVPDRREYIDVLGKDEDYRQRGLFGHIVGATLLEQCTNRLTKGDWTGALACIEYAERFDVRFSRKELIVLLDLSATHSDTSLSAARNLREKLIRLIKRVS